MSLSAASKKEIISSHKRDEQDTGSVEVQVALLTQDILELTEHFKDHPHDFHSRRGLIQKVNQRRKLLRYLKQNDLNRYRALVEKLQLRDSN